mmetsp:Transcript_17344/g.27110  ORF Transcript_17344/g.27110 Transcript_17344/m.27110 type:complete len:93 (-) Transcript_17344:80-358(-)
MKINDLTLPVRTSFASISVLSRSFCVAIERGGRFWGILPSFSAEEERERKGEGEGGERNGRKGGRRQKEKEKEKRKAKKKERKETSTWRKKK